MSYTFDTDFSAAGNTNYIVAEGHGFCIHHSAGTTINMAPTFLRAGTSAHYGIQDGHVRQFLDDRFNAWAAGDAWANNHLIHIECVNESAGGDWPVSEHTVDTLVEFLANKCRELNYPRLDVGETLFGHKDFYNTYCMPVDETELLTPQGWKLLRDINVGDTVAAARMDDLGIVWSHVRAKVKDYVSDCWLSRDFEATADHRVLHYGQTDNERVSPWKEICGCTNKVVTNQNYIPNAGRVYGEGLPLTDAELELIIAVQADGHYSRDSRVLTDNVCSVRFHLSKKRKIERLIALLDECGIRYTVNLKKDGTTDINCNKALYHLAERYLDNKTFTFKMLKMNRHQCVLFLDRILDWDGCRAGNYYCSYDARNRDVVCAVAATSMVGVKVTGNNVYLKSVRRCVNNGGVKRRKQKTVSCVTVDTGFILVRQHGRTTITGNCPGQLYDRLGEIAARVNAMLGSGDWQPAPLPDVPVTQDVPPIKYRVYSERQGWLPEMHNRYDTGGSGDNYGGDGSPILYLAMDFPGWYRVCTERQGWLDPVTQYNVDDLENGCAGDGSPITMVECYYETPDPDATGYVRIRYAVANVGCGFFAEMEDTIPDEYGDTHAGNGGRISAFYAYPLKV